MDSSGLERIRPQLQSLFSKHAKTNKLGVRELEKLCMNLGILPVRHKQDMIGQGSFRLLLTKSFNITSMSNSHLIYSQFEETLLQVALRSSALPSDSQRIAQFVRKISEKAKVNYDINVLATSSSKRKRRSSNANLNFSDSDSDLDSNIKEALQTLRTRERTVRSSCSRNSSRKRFHQTRHSGNLDSSQKPQEPKVIDQKINDLKEFLEMEKIVQSVEVTVDISKPFAPKEYKSPAKQDNPQENTKKDSAIALRNKQAMQENFRYLQNRLIPTQNKGKLFTEDQITNAQHHSSLAKGIDSSKDYPKTYTHLTDDIEEFVKIEQLVQQECINNSKSTGYIGNKSLAKTTKSQKELQLENYEINLEISDNSSEELKNLAMELDRLSENKGNKAQKPEKNEDKLENKEQNLGKSEDIYEDTKDNYEKIGNHNEEMQKQLEQTEHKSTNINKSLNNSMRQHENLEESSESVREIPDTPEKQPPECLANSYENNGKISENLEQEVENSKQTWENSKPDKEHLEKSSEDLERKIDELQFHSSISGQEKERFEESSNELEQEIECSQKLEQEIECSQNLEQEIEFSQKLEQEIECSQNLEQEIECSQKLEQEIECSQKLEQDTNGKEKSSKKLNQSTEKYLQVDDEEMKNQKETFQNVYKEDLGKSCEKMHIEENEKLYKETSHEIVYKETEDLDIPSEDLEQEIKDLEKEIEELENEIEKESEKELMAKSSSDVENPQPSSSANGLNPEIELPDSHRDTGSLMLKFGACNFSTPFVLKLIIFAWKSIISNKKSNDN